MKKEISLRQLIIMLASTTTGFIIYYLFSEDMAVFNSIFWSAYGALILYFLWGEKTR